MIEKDCVFSMTALFMMAQGHSAVHEGGSKNLPVIFTVSHCGFAFGFV
jgi:hypothetical protein